MKLKFLLSAFLLNFSLATFSPERLSRNSGRNSPTVVVTGLVKVSIMYPAAEGKTFDMEYYKNKHMPMVAGFLGSSLVKYTIEKGSASGIPNTPLPFIAIGSFYVKDLAAYQAAIGPNRDAIRADFANYTNISPVILSSEVIK
jgi:uncharacterized protein (TIGR02118 family)